MLVTSYVPLRHCPIDHEDSSNQSILMKTIFNILLDTIRALVVSKPTRIASQVLVNKRGRSEELKIPLQGAKVGLVLLMKDKGGRIRCQDWVSMPQPSDDRMQPPLLPSIATVVEGLVMEGSNFGIDHIFWVLEKRPKQGSKEADVDLGDILGQHSIIWDPGILILTVDSTRWLIEQQLQIERCDSEMKNSG
ncbi:hypothetical protein ACLOJK_026527 [Asimina triloba]